MCLYNEIWYRKIAIVQNGLHIMSSTMKQQGCKITKRSAEIKGWYSVLGTFTSATVSNWLGLSCSRTNTACNRSSLMRQFSLHHPFWIMMRVLCYSLYRFHHKCITLLDLGWLSSKSSSLRPDKWAVLVALGVC